MNNRNWLNFNNADNQMTFELIPKGTLAKVCLRIKAGGYSDINRGWMSGWATKSVKTGTVYLNCQFTIVAGQYRGHKIWSLIGLHSEKSAHWGNSGRSFIKAILNSARGLSSKDNSFAAQQARQLNCLGELDGIEFLARIDVETKPDFQQQNVIKIAITPDRKDYAIYMVSPKKSASGASNSAANAT